MAIKLVKILGNFDTASRDKRELSVVEQLGMETLVLGVGTRCFTYSDAIEVKETPTVKKYQSRVINHALSYAKRLREIRNTPADIFSCHDLINLSMGYLATLLRRPKPKLVYDAHEFEIGRATGGRRGRLGVWWVTHLERFLMRRCAFSIAVNDSIADEMVRVHRLSERPVVVRSTPYLWERDEAAVRAARESFCSELGADPDEAFVVMYHGAVVRGRGVEQVIEAASLAPKVSCVVLGDGDASYLDELRALAKGFGVEGRVLFRPAVPREGLEAFVAAADVGMVACQAITRSYYLMLPNKFFENVQAETPIVASDFPETSRLIERYGIGLTCDPSDLGQVVDCIERLRTDKDLYGECKSNLKAAKRELCWERERKGLEHAYRNLAETIEQP